MRLSFLQEEPKRQHVTPVPFSLPPEFQRQESVRSQRRGLQLYDTPYEPETHSIDSDSEITTSPRLRESKLPQDDDRPADEYDQPWEWNRVTIPALAGEESMAQGSLGSASPNVYVWVWNTSPIPPVGFILH